MSINPDNITTIRVDQLAESTLNLTNEFPHSEDTTLRKATIQSLVDLVATAVGSGSGVGFLPISVTDGQQLPDVPADPSFFLCGAGTYLNVNGYPNVVCTDELNAVMSLTDHWQLSVGIPITADLQSIGISQSVNDGVLDKAPSENAVYNFISQWLPKSSLGYFDYADLATQTTPITVASGVQTLLTNDTLGDDTNTSQPPYGVTAIWDADSDEFNFQQLSVGDTVDIRVHLKTTTTTANQKYHVDMKFAFDGPSEFENRIFSQYVKTASEDEQTFITTLYIGSEDVKNYPARLYITSDDDATVEVVGWFCRVFRKSVNIVSVDEAPIDGLTYGRKDAEWVEMPVQPTQQYKFLLSQSGGDDPQTATSGTLTQGVTYEIVAFETGDDFTLSGAPNNDVGTKWIANGVAPTWSNGSEIGWNGGSPFIYAQISDYTSYPFWFEWNSDGFYNLAKTGDFDNTKTFYNMNFQSADPLGDFTSGARMKLNSGFIVFSSFDTNIPANDIIDKTPVEITIKP